MNRLLMWLYDVLHRKYHARTMTWYRLTANVGGKIIRLRIYGPKGMRMTDVVFEEMPEKVEWYKLRSEEDERRRGEND